MNLQFIFLVKPLRAIHKTLRGPQTSIYWIWLTGTSQSNVHLNNTMYFAGGVKKNVIAKFEI